jgi:hypothetical protein
MAKEVNKSGLQTFISYFQKVTTIGIVSRAKSAKEAESKSRKKIKNSELTCGLVAETPFEATATETWLDAKPVTINE